MRNLKKVIALVAVFAMMVSTVAFAQTFTDVAATDNYAEAIETLSALGIITGDDQDEDGKMDFRPADTITRAEVAAIISRIQGMNNATQTATEFEDVPSTHWASGYVAQAANQGIINGYGDGKFGPEDPVLYEQAIKMLMETLGYRPFANENGGYPTGYTTAAQRYGVLDGVIGGGIGATAPRGMIAQLVFNAIDTPIMDKYTYGNEAQYVVYDKVDGNYGFMTLLTRDLKMVKVSGTVVGNSYSAGVDTSREAAIELKLNQTNDNYNYLKDLAVKAADGTVTLKNMKNIYQGEIDADGYLGYAVTLYAKTRNNSNAYDLVAIAMDGTKNEGVTFALDQYEAFDTTKDADGNITRYAVKYLKNETDRNATTEWVQANPTIIYNGSVSAGTMDKFFDALIKKDTKLGGTVTLMDNDDVAGADVVVIEIGVSAVVKEVTSRGQVKFMRSVEVPAVDGNVNVKDLTFDEEDTNVLNVLTKDGADFDYADLEEWDVLTVIYDGVHEVYNVRVLSADNYVDGIIDGTKGSDPDTQYKIGGNWYELAKASYLTIALESGVSGRFYIDEYGKIVAHNRDIAVEGAVESSSGNYAFVLNAKDDADDWGNKNVRVQVLDKSGEIYEAYMAETVKLVNFNNYAADANLKLVKDVDGNAITATVSDTYKVAELAPAENLAKGLIGKMITYTANADKEIKSITLAGPKGSEGSDLAFATDYAATKVHYDEDTMTFANGASVDDETLVFYIVGSKAYAYGDVPGDTESYNKSVCNVVKASELPEGDYNYVAFDNDRITDNAKVVVIMNESGAISPSSNIAVIDGVGKSVVNGTDTISVVEYYVNGEKLTANTDPNLNSTVAAQIAAAGRGDLFKLNVTDGVITNAEAIMVFDRAKAADAAYVKDATALPVLKTVNGAKIAVAKSNEVFYAGPVMAIAYSGNVTLATVKAADGTLSGSTTIVKEGDANVYVYDPAMRDARQLVIGGLSDAELDEDLVAASTTVKGGDLLAPIVNTDGAQAYGMLDFVFARYFYNKPADIVVYKNYDFGKYVVE